MQVLGRVLTPDGGLAVQVLGRVLEQAVAAVVVLHRVHGDGLEAAPAKRHDDRVTCLQDALVPAVLLQAKLQHKTMQLLNGMHGSRA